jgi:hypothetical protein
MIEQRPKCSCCQDSGTVPDITGAPRPCSRCRADDFIAWYRARFEAEGAFAAPRQNGGDAA